MVTSRKRADVSARRPEPWQLGQVAVLPPRALPMRPSPPHMRQISPCIRRLLARPRGLPTPVDIRRRGLLEQLRVEVVRAGAEVRRWLRHDERPVAAHRGAATRAWNAQAA